MDIRALLDELAGIGDRECQLTPDYVVKLCAAILELHAKSFGAGTRGVSTHIIYGASALREAARALADLSAEEILARLRKAVQDDEIEIDYNP